MAVTFGSELMAAEVAAAESKAAAAETPEKPVEEVKQEPSAPASEEKPPEQGKNASESETGGEGEPGGEGNRRNRSAEKRIGRLTKELREAQREIAELKKGSAPAAERTQTVDPDQEPKEDDYEDHAEYLKAVGRYEARQAIKEERAREAQEKAQAEFDAKLYKSREKHADFDDVIAEAEDILIPEAAIAAMNDSEDPGEIAYYLATHPEQAEKLSEMTPIKQVAYIARLEAQLSSGDKKAPEPPAPKQQPKASAAPAPLKPLSTATGERPAFDPYTAESTDPRWQEYREQRRKQLQSA